MKEKSTRPASSVENIYKLDGRVPVAKAIPFGLQHVLAMFVANVTPVMLIASVAGRRPATACRRRWKRWAIRATSPSATSASI